MMMDISHKFGDASRVAGNYSSKKKTLLFIDDRPNTLASRVFERDDYNLVLIRHENHSLPYNHLEKTKKFLTYYRDNRLSTEDQIQCFVEWCAANGIKPDYILNPSEPEQHFAHALGRHVGIPSLSEDQVKWLRNKVAMKDKFREIGLSTAEYAAVSTHEEIIQFAEVHGWPVVIKPQEGFACINTYKLSSDEEVRDFHLAENIGWMVESFVDGTEWECCALISKGMVLDTYLSYMPARPLEIVDGAINANITVRPHPSDFSIDTKDLVEKLVNGMGLDHGYMHMEFFINSNGEFFMGETALRLAGCEIPENHGLAFGFNIFDVLIDIHLDENPSMQYGGEHCVGDLLLPAAKGKITYMTPREELMNMPGVISYKPRISVGDFVDPRRASHTCSAVVHVEGDDVGHVLERMYCVLNNYKISTELDIGTVLNPKL